MKFKTLVVDPPWKFSSPGWLGGANRHYNTVPLEGIRELPIDDVLEEDGHLWLWTTKDHRDTAAELLDLWGLTFRAVWHWVKLTKNPLSAKQIAQYKEKGVPTINYQNDIYGLGWGIGYYNRGTTEYLLFATRGEVNVPDHHKARQVRDVFFAPLGDHSEKPEVAYEMIRRYSPSKRLDMFARSTRYGFYQWGNGAIRPIKIPKLDDWSTVMERTYQ